MVEIVKILKQRIDGNVYRILNLFKKTYSDDYISYIADSVYVEKGIYSYKELADFLNINHEGSEEELSRVLNGVNWFIIKDLGIAVNHDIPF